MALPKGSQRFTGTEDAARMFSGLWIGGLVTVVGAVLMHWL